MTGRTGRDGTRRMALLAAAIAAALAAGAPVAAEPSREVETVERTAGDQRQGDEAAPQLAAKFGGALADPELQAYVDRIGRRLAQVTEQPGEPWTFTVLDSPTVNAFALPGGQVYLTRGLVALANSEAELAGVIGHEMGHVTAGHAGSRQTRGAWATGLLIGARILGAIAGVDEGLLDAGGQIGQLAAGGILADYSREDELVADRLGVRYLARAGYDPYAQADFLESLAAWGALDARDAGRDPAPATGFFDSHPATPERARIAVELAREAGGPILQGDARGRERHLDAVDGLVFGDAPEQGFVRGQTFSHPVLGFTYQVPDGFRIRNAPDAVRAAGPDGARFILDGAPDDGGALAQYIEKTWLPAISRQFPVGEPRWVDRRRINGLEAAVAEVPVTIGQRRHDALLTVVRMDGKLYRLAGLAPNGSGMFERLEEAAESFRRLSPAETRALAPARIKVVTVRPGETVATLAATMPDGPLAEERFRVLNALEAGEEVRPGQRVKLVR